MVDMDSKESPSCIGGRTNWRRFEGVSMDGPALVVTACVGAGWGVLAAEGEGGADTGRRIAVEVVGEDGEGGGWYPPETVLSLWLILDTIIEGNAGMDDQPLVELLAAGYKNAWTTSA
jgi:hypothetical protein